MFYYKTKLKGNLKVKSIKPNDKDITPVYEISSSSSLCNQLAYLFYLNTGLNNYISYSVAHFKILYVTNQSKKSDTK